MCSTWVLELLFWVWIWVLPCFELNQCGGGVWVGCSFVRGTEQAQPWLWRWLRCKGATVSLAWPGSTYLWSWVSHISNFLHFMRVCPMFNLDEICFQTLCLNGGHPFILGEGMGNQSDLRICQISDCPHVWNACVVCSNWLEIVSKNCVSVVATQLFWARELVNSLSRMWWIMREWLWVSQKRLVNSLFQECEEEWGNDCEFLKIQIACTPRVCLMFNLTTH